MGDGRSFRQQPHRRAQGQIGEDAAARWLATQGYTLVERNVRNRAGEIDAIAHRGGVLCFIEIKARSSDRFGPALAAVSPAKQRRIARAAALYLTMHPWDGACRFDVLGLDLRADGRWEFSLVEDAFSVS